MGRGHWIRDELLSKFRDEGQSRYTRYVTERVSSFFNYLAQISTLWSPQVVHSSKKPRKIFYYNRSCKFKYSYSFYAYAFVCFFKYVELRLNHNFWIHSYLNLGKYWISKRAIGGIGYIETIFSVTHLLDGVCRGSSKVLRPHKNIFFFLVLWRLKKWCARAIFIFIFYLFYKVKLRFLRQ